MIKNHIIYNNYSEWTFDISRAEGNYVYDSHEKRMIDFTSGWNVTNLGWNNPEIISAVKEQLKKNTYAPMWTADSIQNQLASELIKVLPRVLDSVGRATGGTEANEEAIKTARAHTGRHKIVGFKDTYHGQSFGSMSIGFRPEHVESISPMVGDFVQIDFPKLYGDKRTEIEILKDYSDRLEKLLQGKDIAAIVTEAGMITGWGSAYVAPAGFLRVTRDLCTKYGTLLILDEVGTGFSRLGKFFGMEIENVIPDIVTLAKGLSNGVAAIGAMVTTTKIAENTYKATNNSSTFGWMPISCAAAIKTLQIHQRDKIWEQSHREGEYLKSALSRELKDHPHVADVRGVGMEIGIQFIKGQVDKIVDCARDKGLHLVCDHTTVIQLMPPLVIDRKTLDKGIDILISSIKSFL
jgi:acetylornithine aminotransferase